MKRLLIAVLTLTLLFTAAACGRPAPAPAPVEEPAPAPAETPAPEPDVLPEFDEDSLRFSTTRFDGSAADESILSGCTLTMINFFEPWCPPCVGELPELETLYENYRDKGFQILGVYSTEEGTAEVLSDAGVSYPILRYTEIFDRFQTGYVPTTIFVDGAGHVVGETVIGSHSYAEWEEIVKGLLG